MERIKLTSSNHQQIIDKAIATLGRGGLIIYPTETCYGVGVDPTKQSAVNKLLRYKGNRSGKPISVAVSGQKVAARYVHLNKIAKDIYEQFLPGPVTVISKSKGKLARGIESKTGGQGIRVPAHPFVIKLLEGYGKPITATSANASDKKVPYTIADILDNLSAQQKALIGLIIDAGRLPKHKPSTVVDTTLKDLKVVREGLISLRKLNENRQ